MALASPPILNLACRSNLKENWIFPLKLGAKAQGEGYDVMMEIFNVAMP